LAVEVDLPLKSFGVLGEPRIETPVRRVDGVFDCALVGADPDILDEPVWAPVAGVVSSPEPVRVTTTRATTAAVAARTAAQITQPRRAPKRLCARGVAGASSVDTESPRAEVLVVVVMVRTSRVGSIGDRPGCGVGRCRIGAAAVSARYRCR
jgi:hypothetical protein